MRLYLHNGKGQKLNRDYITVSWWRWQWMRYYPPVYRFVTKLKRRMT